MDSVKAALSKSYAGIPGIAWAGIIAVGAWLILPHLGGGAKPAANAAGTTPTGQATTDYSLGYAQGIQAAGTDQRTGSTVVPGAVAGASPNMTIFQTYVAALSANQLAELHRLGYSTSSPNRLSRQQVTELQKNGYNWRALQGWAGDIPADLGAMPAGYGGAGGDPGAGAMVGLGGAKVSIGSRSATLMSPHHPLITQRVRYPHYVRAVGGPSQHHAEVHRVAASAGIHPARLLALNPHHTGLIRIA